MDTTTATAILGISIVVGLHSVAQALRQVASAIFALAANDDDKEADASESRYG